MKTGKAYAFLDYESGWDALVRLMAINQQMANFSDALGFTVLDDKLDEKYDHKTEGLPAEIAKAAESADVYGHAPISRIRDAMGIKPKKAAELRYVIIAQSPELLGQGRANQKTAGMLNEVLGILGTDECLAGKRRYLRWAVFYQDSRRRPQRYVKC